MLHIKIIKLIKIIKIPKILSFFIILLKNKKNKERYAKAKYKLYNIKPFSAVPHPISNNNTAEKITHSIQKFANLFFLLSI